MSENVALTIQIFVPVRARPSPKKKVKPNEEEEEEEKRKRNQNVAQRLYVILHPAFYSALLTINNEADLKCLVSTLLKFSLSVFDLPVIKCHSRTESVTMTLKIMYTYAHYVTLGSHCKMASTSSHRLTDLEKNPL